MEGRLVSTCIHRYGYNLYISKDEKSQKTVERTLVFNVVKQNAHWTIRFVISSTGSQIKFSTNPTNVLRQMQRVSCKIINDNSGLDDIAFGSGQEMADEDFQFFAWHDVKKIHKKDGCVKICFDLIGAYADESTPPRRPAAADLKMLPFLASGEHSDVTITTADKELKAHKLVLAARSPVFAAMFRNDMQEATTGRVTINDARTEVVEEMLRYMYSNASIKLPEMARELFAAAHMYDVRDLQGLCIDHLLRNMRADNVVEILKLCDTYELEIVKRHVLKFVDGNEEAVVKREEYLVYLQERVNVDNLTKNLLLAGKYELPDFKLFLMDFIAKNYTQVMQNYDYRRMYRDGASMDFILEIDEYILNNIEKLRDA